jgi:uncharacterized protein YjiS (DUF1127 family)
MEPRLQIFYEVARCIAVKKIERQRIRRRAELRRLLETGHHLVVDTGMGVDEALHEIAKPFYAE